ncbi:hypothetical protein BBP40_009488 [Aspergillus hancockii]|nr:hypothetical protein BBP40_009488 [Aspergillus hancockii]
MAIDQACRSVTVITGIDLFQKCDVWLETFERTFDTPPLLFGNLSSSQPGTPGTADACLPAPGAVGKRTGYILLSVKVPMAMLASKEESSDDVMAYESNLRALHHVETFSTQIQGWMAARSNWEDVDVRKGYEREYDSVLGFLEQYI